MQASIESLRIGLVAGLIGVCAASMAAPPAPDGSFERPYPQPRQAAASVVAEVQSALARYRGAAEPPLVAVAYTETVSPDVIEAVRDVLSSTGMRQTASGAWLEVLVQIQNRMQSGAYTPAPRAALAQADFVLAIDEIQAAPGLALMRAAVLTLSAGGVDRWRGAGEIVPGSAVSAYVGTAVAPGTIGLKVKGTGYCNRSLPSERWRYSALRAAELDAQAAWLRARGGETVRASSGTAFRRLEANRVTAEVHGDPTPARVVSTYFDPSSCRAVVALTDDQAAPARRDRDTAWWLRLMGLVSVVLSFP